ncbi:MAG: hypothetical protein HY985_15520 [Magnetospirillum sp.]|nr:hypothetical protein [Magnetospirillum sp.]
MPDDIDSLRRRLLGALPARIDAALAGYETFAAAPPPADAKGFAAWHAAAKAALAHIELLVKLARWAEGKADDPTPTAVGDPGLDCLLAEARAALDGFDDDDEDCES